jgi:hypothetical protein
MALKETQDIKNILQKVESTKRRSTSYALASLKELNKNIKNMEFQNYPSNQIHAYKRNALEAIKLDLIENNQKELNDLFNVKDKLRQGYEANYEKDYLKNDRKLNDYKHKLSAMAVKELAEEMGNYINGDFPIDTDSRILDELCIHAKKYEEELSKQKDSELLSLESFRKVMIDNKYNEPYMKDSIGKSINKNIDVLSQNVSNVVFDYDDTTLSALTIEDVNDFITMDDTEETL